MGFYSNMKDTLTNDNTCNRSVTENGAIGWKTSGHELLDLNFAVASMRNWSESCIVEAFKKAFYEDPKYAIIWLYYLRDAREGLGERRSFRAIMRDLAMNNYSKMTQLIPLIAEYGRWDDVVSLLDSPYRAQVVSLIKAQVNEDWKNHLENKPISLCAKWLPSCNTSSKETVRLARILVSGLGLTEAKYRKTLSVLRNYLNVVEVKMSAKNWEDIDYSAVPSRANLIYNGAFLRNDEIRRRAFLSKVEKGEEKINASVLFPHDIVCKYQTPYSYSYLRVDSTLEALWKNLPDMVKGNGNTIVVSDGSGSMGCHVGNTNVSAWDVAHSLAMYFAEHMSGEFKDKYITFSNTPKFVDFSKCETLKDKINVAKLHREAASTNIERVFELILDASISHNLAPSEIPNNILIISDLEFNMCCKFPNANLFEQIKIRFENAGYTLPRLVFWNVNSRTNTIPIKQNEAGVALVSGFSPNIVKMVLSNTLDPYKCLLEQLDAKRYNPIKAIMELN